MTVAGENVVLAPPTTAPPAESTTGTLVPDSADGTGRPPGQRAIQGWKRGRTQNRVPRLRPALAGCRNGRNREQAHGAE